MIGGRRVERAKADAARRRGARRGWATRRWHALATDLGWTFRKHQDGAPCPACDAEFFAACTDGLVAAYSGWRVRRTAHEAAMLELLLDPATRRRCGL